MRTIPTAKDPIIIGSFEELEKKKFNGEITSEEYQAIFEESRKHGLDGSLDYAIGGSTAAKILGESEYGGPAGVAYELSHAKKSVPHKEARPLFVGHTFEAPFRELFTYDTGIEAIPWYEQAVNPNWPHCLANIDGLCFEQNPITGEMMTGIYEGKSARFNSEHAKLFQEGQVPPDYMIQLQFYMEVWNLPFAWINCGWGLNEGDQRAIRVDRDREYGCEICQACEDFIDAYKSGKPITNASVTSVKARLADFYKAHAWGDKQLEKVELDSKLSKYLHSAEAEDAKIAAIKAVIKPVTDNIETLEAEKKALEKSIKNQLDEITSYEDHKVEILLPLMEEMGDATLGTITDKTTKESWIIKCPEAGFSKDAKVMAKFKEEFPTAYEALRNIKPTPRKLSVVKTVAEE